VERINEHFVEEIIYASAYIRMFKFILENGHWLLCSRKFPIWNHLNLNQDWKNIIFLSKNKLLKSCEKVSDKVMTHFRFTVLYYIVRKWIGTRFIVYYSEWLDGLDYSIVTVAQIIFQLAIVWCSEEATCPRQKGDAFDFRVVCLTVWGMTSSATST